MAIVGHGVGNSGAKKTFNGAQKRDRQHRAHEAAQGGEGQVRNREVGKFLRNAAEFAPDRFYGKVEGGNDDRRQYEHDHGAGEVSNPALPRGAVHRVALGPEHDDEETYECHAEGIGVEGRDVRGQGFDLTEEAGRHFVDREAEKVLHLRESDENRNTVRKADHDRHRNEADEASELKEPHQKEDDPGTDRRN